MKRKKIRAFDVALACVMTVLSLIFLLPFWIIVVSSLSENLQLMTNGISVWFQGFTFDGYQLLFGLSDKFIRSIWVSLYTSFLAAVLSVVACSLCAYALSKKYLVGRNAITVFVLIPMFFSGGMMPLYLVIRGINLYNTVWALILPGMVSSYYIVLVRNFFYGISESLEEAAQLDGANDLQVFTHIYLPLSIPMMCAIACMRFVAQWNSWMPSLLYVAPTSEHLWTVQYVLRQMLYDMKVLVGTNIADAPTVSAQNAAIVVVVLPLILMSPILHKYFTAGMTMGAVKG
jgi:putative aldouronate transport system permease protein